MKNILLLSAALLFGSSLPANAGGISFEFFNPAPVYAAPVYIPPPPPRPIYVVQQYTDPYSYYYPVNYSYSSNRYWDNKRQCWRYDNDRRPHHDRYDRYDRGNHRRGW